MTATRATITLQAPADRIWALLSDFALYPQWNPLFTQAKGRVLAGEEVELTVQLPGMAPFAVQAELLCAEAQGRLLWRYRPISRWFFCWSYEMEVTETASGEVEFFQRSRFAGLLGPLFSFALETRVEGGMAELNRAIRRWGEQGNVRCLRC